MIHIGRTNRRLLGKIELVLVAIEDRTRGDKHEPLHAPSFAEIDDLLGCENILFPKFRERPPGRRARGRVNDDIGNPVQLERTRQVGPHVAGQIHRSAPESADLEIFPLGMPQTERTSDESGGAGDEDLRLHSGLARQRMRFCFSAAGCSVHGRKTISGFVRASPSTSLARAAPIPVSSPPDIRTSQRRPCCSMR